MNQTTLQAINDEVLAASNGGFLGAVARFVGRQATNVVRQAAIGGGVTAELAIPTAIGITGTAIGVKAVSDQQQAEVDRVNAEIDAILGVGQ